MRITGNMNPAILAEKNVKLAAEYESLSDEYARLRQRHAVRWLEIKHEKEKRTVEETNKLWDVTEDGQKMIALKCKLEGLEKVIDANQSYIFVLNQQSKNNAAY